MQLQIPIPTSDDFRAIIREELAAFASTFQPQPPAETDDIGKGAEFAAKITGKAVPTIYSLVAARAIPHSKQGKDLYFSRKRLLAWMTEDGRRKTTKEIAEEAANHSAASAY